MTFVLFLLPLYLGKLDKKVNENVLGSARL